MQDRDRIILVYNADGDAMSVLVDAVHKIVSPRTYPCSLCALSHGWFTMRPKWRRYLAQLPHETEALHRDEFHAAYGEREIPWPAILAEQGEGRLDVLLSKRDLDALGNVDDLIAAMDKVLAMRAVSA